MHATATLIGRVGQVGEIAKAGDTDRIGFRLATDRRKNINGAWTDVPTWWGVEVYGRDAAYLHEHLATGQAVTVTGMPYLDEWATQAGEKRQTLRLRADKVILHRSPKGPSHPVPDRRASAAPVDPPARSAPAAPVTTHEPPF